MTTVQGRVWKGGDVVATDFPLEDLDTWLADDQVLTWVDICQPEPSHLAVLAEELGLDPLAVEDACADGERVKLSRYSNHLFVTAYSARIVPGATPEEHESNLVASQISVFVMPRGLITVRHDPGYSMSEVLSRWNDGADLLVHGVFALLHGLLDTLVDEYFVTIGHLDEVIEDLEDGLFGGTISNTALQPRVYRLRKELVELRRVVLPMREVVASILRRRLSGSAALDGWYEDLYDHILRSAEWTESLRDMLSGLFETNLSLQDARLNTIMKKLAGWAAVIAVPTAVTGWFGQNVPYPGFSTSFGLYQSIALILVGTVGLYLLFRKYDWI